MSVALAVVAFFAASPFVFLDAGEHVVARCARIQREHRARLARLRARPLVGHRVRRASCGTGSGPVLADRGGRRSSWRSSSGRAAATSCSARSSSRYYVSLLPLHSHFPRYVLPLVPALGALAGRFRALAPVTLLLLIVPLTWSIRDDARADAHGHAHRRRALDRGARAEGIDDRRRVVDGRAARATRVVPIPLPLPGHDARVDVGRRALGARQRRRCGSRAARRRTSIRSGRRSTRGSEAPAFRHARARRNVRARGWRSTGCDARRRVRLLALVACRARERRRADSPASRPVVVTGCDGLYYERAGMPQRARSSPTCRSRTARTRRCTR